MNINLFDYNIHLTISILYNINVRIFYLFFVTLCRQTYRITIMQKYPNEYKVTEKGCEQGAFEGIYEDKLDFRHSFLMQN